MNPSPASHPPLPDVTPGEASEISPSPVNWQTALDTLITSRIELFQIESKEVTGKLTRSIIFLAISALAVLFGWGLILAGLVQLIHSNTHWPLHWVALGVGFLHLLFALILVMLARPSQKSTFPVTRAEFQKDREWLHQILRTKKSND